MYLCLGLFVFMIGGYVFAKKLKTTNGVVALCAIILTAWSGIVPAKIAGYVAEHYPSSGIEKIEHKRYGYEVELTNDLDMKFGADGRFLGIDD